MRKPPNLKHKKSQMDLPGIAYVIAFLLGILLFLFFGESLFGVKPQPVWIAGLMGLTVSAIVFWVWSAIHKKNKNHDTHD